MTFFFVKHSHVIGKKNRVGRKWNFIMVEQVIYHLQ